MRPTRVALADDEEMARKRLARLLASIPEVELVLTAASGEALLDGLEAARPDILLLDIQMPGLSGLDAAQLLQDPAPYVIYVSAHPEHALSAFDVGAVDYVVKPVEAGRLKRALDRARSFLERNETTLEAPVTLARLPFETRDGIVMVDPCEVTHASFDGALVTLHATGGPIVTDRRLSDLADALTPHGFERVHRRHLLNLRRVVRFEDQPSGAFVAHCDDGAQVPVSRQVARLLRKRLLPAAPSTK